MPEDSDRPRRQPNNLQGLLRFAVEATRSEDAPASATSALPPMDAERRAFLEHALASMTVNVVAQLESAAAVLTDPEATEPQQLAALDCLCDYVDNIDTANDFCKIGGLAILLPCLAPAGGRRSPAVRRQSAALVAELAQNNPFAQKQLLEADVLGRLLPLLQAEDEALAAAGLRAISACCRGFEPAAAALIEMGGLELALAALRHSGAAADKLVMHSLFLLRALCQEYPGVRDELRKLEAVGRVVGALGRKPVTGEYDAVLEAALATLDILTDWQALDNREPVDGDDGQLRRLVQAECEQSDLGLRAKLAEVVRRGEGHEECREAVEAANVLLGRLFGADRVEGREGHVDR